MYTLSTEKKLAVISGLVEGNSLRSISRMTDVDRNTINSLLLRTGENCASLLDTRMRQLSCRRLQCDEIWTYVGKKARHVKDSDPAEFGDQWVYVALDADTKLVPSYFVGKRNSENTQAFMLGIVSSSIGPQDSAHHGCVYFLYQSRSSSPSPGMPTTRNSKSSMATMGSMAMNGTPQAQSWRLYPERLAACPIRRMCSTSFVERQNLTIRMQMRRFTRLTNAFSKRLENLKAACALHFAHYNFCRVHSSLRVTPAMAAGLTTEVWPLRALLV